MYNQIKKFFFLSFSKQLTYIYIFFLKYQNNEKKMIHYVFVTDLLEV